MAYIGNCPTAHGKGSFMQWKRSVMKEGLGLTVYLEIVKEGGKFQTKKNVKNN